MSWLWPIVAHAAVTPIPLLDNIKREIVNPIILLLAALSLVVFLYGVYEMLANADNAEARITGQQHVLWGVIGLFIVFSVFGILHLICNTIGCQ